MNADLSSVSNLPVTLALDTEAVDNAPAEIVAGAVMAASPNLQVLLVGRPEVVEPLLVGADRDYIEVVPSGSVITRIRSRLGDQSDAGFVHSGGCAYCG